MIQTINDILIVYITAAVIVRHSERKAPTASCIFF